MCSHDEIMHCFPSETNLSPDSKSHLSSCGLLFSEDGRCSDLEAFELSSITNEPSCFRKLHSVFWYSRRVDSSSQIFSFPSDLQQCKNH